MKEQITCVSCGEPLSSKEGIVYEDKIFCERCFSKFGTCFMCIHKGECGFHNNPSPIPKEVEQQVQQGPMVITKLVPNPKRIKTFCIEGHCKCYNNDNNNDFCAKMSYMTCPNYKEITF